MNTFRSPAESLGTLDAPTAADLIGAAADIALVLDVDGVVRDVSATGEASAGRDWHEWIGQRWADIVTVECRGKVHDLMSPDATTSARQRQVNHVFADGTELAVLYSTMRLNADGDRIAFGKDLSSLTRLQQRLVNVQQSMERDYSRLRQFEMRYRLLLQTSSEAIIVAHASTLRIVEVNPVACTLLESTERKLVGSPLSRWFDEERSLALEDGIASARHGGQPITLSLGEGDDALLASLSVLKGDAQPLVLVRLRSAGSRTTGDDERSEQVARLLSLVEIAPDGLVITDARGKILVANGEFVDLVQLARAELACGRELSEWLGQGGPDYHIIMTSLREHGSIRLYATQLRGEAGSITDVEVSAVLVGVEGVDCIGFSIRNISFRVAANDDSVSPSMAPHSVDRLTQLVGRVPLKELVRESTELIEQLCIEAALKLTGNNRASAADLLGLSRQSLYVKLRRYGLGTESEAPD